MRDEYLWDRSGEPDPEIERLERTLQGLRHQSKPLALPVAHPRRQIFHGWAAAAAVALLVLAGGVWVALRRADDTQAQRLALVRPVPGSLSALYRTADTFTLALDEEMNKRVASREASPVERVSRPRRLFEERRVPSVFVSRATPRRKDDRFTSEGERAKERLMLALHFASSKLNLVQRKIQVNKENGPAS
ncbi:MAG TPA: hypothetical protein VF553_05450 [Pyrinomonadaceae bacterium]|jgi:hypothetical protein